MYPVLLVDDEIMIKKSIRKMIESGHGPFVVAGEAKNGKEALELAERVSPRLIITDIRMPMMDGLQLIEEALKRWPHIKFIIVSGYNDFAYAQRALQLGAFDFLLKPIRPQEFMETLGSIQSRLVQEHKEMEERILWLKRCKSHCPQLVEAVWLLDEVNALSNWKRISNEFTAVQIKYLAVEEIFMHLQSFIEEELALKNAEVWSLPTEGVWHWSGEWQKNDSLMETFLLELISGLRKIRNFGINQFVRKALEYTAEHYNKDYLTLQSAAEFIGITAPYLSRCFREETGQTFIQYLTNIRMEKAKRALQDPLSKVYEVAFQVGYQEYAHFSRVFRKYTGYSPTEYRKITGNN